MNNPFHGLKFDELIKTGWLLQQKLHTQNPHPVFCEDAIDKIAHIHNANQGVLPSMLCELYTQVLQ